MYARPIELHAVIHESCHYVYGLPRNMKFEAQTCADDITRNPRVYATCLRGVDL